MTDDKGRPTMKEVATEVEKLKAMTPKIKRSSVYGEIDCEAIQADITVLEKGMSKDEIFVLWEGEREYTLSSALGARRWLDGDETSCPSDSWAPFVVD